MSSRRPLAIYSAKRRQRSISNPHFRPLAPSSPLKPLGSEDGDLSVAEMSRRMIKRSRSGLSRSGSASTGASPNETTDGGSGRLENARPAKKSRVVCESDGSKVATARVPLQTILEPGNNIPMDDTGMSVDMDLTSVLQLKTPTPRDDTAPTLPGATHLSTRDMETADFLSPLPSNHSSKRVLTHRTSSTQLKENNSRVSGVMRSASASKMDTGLLSPAPLSLASPFNSRPGSPSRKKLGGRRSSKKGTSKTLNRTRSVGTDLRRKATMRSYSRAVSPAPSDAQGTSLNRHPSLPTSLATHKDKEDWFISPRLKQPGLNTSPLERAQTPISQAPYVREASFFNASPQACSTPVPRNRVHVLDVPPTPGLHDSDATPRLPLNLYSAALTFENKLDYSLIDEPTPRARPLRTGPALDSLLNAEDSLFPDSYMHDALRTSNEEPSKATNPGTATDNARRRMTIHLSQDSIFSSAMDLSVSMTAKQPLPFLSARSQVNSSSQLAVAAPTGGSSDPDILVPPSSPALPVSPASSAGDELRDMFSILGLDEDEQHWNLTHDQRDFISDTVSGPIKPKKTKPLSVQTTRAHTRSKTRTPPASSISRAVVRNKQGISSPMIARPRVHKTVQPTIKMKIDAEALSVGSDDSDDVLLLTSKGWEWDPKTKQIVPTV